MKRRINGINRSSQVLFFWTLVGLALLMTLKYFPGLEATSAYAGNVFQAIYPNAFPGDPYIGAERSISQKVYQISLFYLGPMIMGEIWLDDRFVFIVYLLLVVITLVGIDRIVRLAGIKDILPRLVIQLILMRDHHYLTQTMTFANQPDLNHAAFAIPATVWLIYVTLAQRSLWLILGLCVLTAAFSVKMAPYVIAFSLIIAAINGGHRDCIIIVAIFALALAAFVYAVVYLFPVPEGDRLVLWDLIYHEVENYDSNPFYPRPDVITMVKKNVVFAVTLIAAGLAPLPKTAVSRGLRTFVWLGVAVWLAGGLYYSFAPDALKVVHLFPFSLTRNLRWPQTMAYLLITISVFYWLKEHRSWRDLAGATTIFLALLVVGPGNHELWAGLFVVCVVVVMGAHAFHRQIVGNPAEFSNPYPWISNRYPLLLAQALMLTIGISFASTIWKKLPEWRTWAVYGIHGNSPVAKWIGVPEYLRKNTPPDSVVLPLEEEDPGTGLKSRRHLASRSGRTIPIIMEYSSIFDLQLWKTEKQQVSLMGRFQEATKTKDWKKAAEELKGLILEPDYIILRQRYVNAEFLKFFPYAQDAQVGDFAILKRIKRPQK